eukprot:Tbor_TRINITY_DN5092_c0_g1::TRINITY_DN5092_c0_g1_i1::g.14355::m.14355
MTLETLSNELRTIALSTDSRSLDKLCVLFLFSFWLFWISLRILACMIFTSAMDGGAGQGIQMGLHLRFDKSSMKLNMLIGYISEVLSLSLAALYSSDRGKNLENNQDT